jgi:hypothetical protein
MDYQNPYQPSTTPVAPLDPPRTSLRRIIMVLRNVAIVASGMLLLSLRGCLERTMFWGRAGVVTGETDTELLFYSLLTDPVWRSTTTQTVIIVAPAFVLCLLWLRKHFT